jgi:hypothetical protein
MDMSVIAVREAPSEQKDGASLRNRELVYSQQDENGRSILVPLVERQ